MGNRATPSPFNQRRHEARAKKKAMRLARIERDKKMEAWRNLPEDKWTLERRVANRKAKEEDLKELSKELDSADEEKPLTDEAMSEINTLKRQAANLKGRITKAQKKRAAAEKLKDPKERAEGIEVSEGEIEELQVALVYKEGEIKVKEQELREKMDPKKLRRLSWLRRWLGGHQKQKQAVG